MSKKLAIIGPRGYPANFPGSSGIDAFIEKLSPYISNQTQTSIFVRPWSKSKKNNKTNIISIPCIKHKYLDTGLYSILVTPIALLKKQQIFWYNAPGSCLTIFLAKIFKKKTILTIHGIEWQRQKWTSLERFFIKLTEIMAINTANHITAVSSDLQKYIKQKYNITAHLTPPGFSFRKPLPAKLIKQKYHLKKNKYILYLGRLVPEKRVDWLINTFLNLKNSQKHKLIIAANLTNTPYSKSLQKLVKQNPNIIFTNYVSGKLKQELLSNCKLFILPSSLEGNSIALQEALEFQAPCLISNLPVHKQLSKKHSNITLFKNNSTEDFFQKLKKILKKPTINKKTNKNTIHLWKNTPPSWEKTGQTLLNIFHS
ncbi:glycosyltransferase family 4 protein [Patescibacteria group bacterium]|nr:glycosyltransferase family 4 protein [Patescibacteria group bacterium]